MSKKIYFLIDRFHPSIGGLYTATNSINHTYSRICNTEILPISETLSSVTLKSIYIFLQKLHKIKMNSENIIISHGYFSLSFLIASLKFKKLYCYPHGMLNIRAIRSKSISIFKKYLFISLIKILNNEIVFIALTEKEYLQVIKFHKKNRVIIIENFIN